MTAKRSQPASPQERREDRKLVLVVSPDEYLLEMECRERVAAWKAAHPDGESVTLDPAPPPVALVKELVNRSLFFPVRLAVVPDASPYLKTSAEEATWGDALAAALAPLANLDATVLLAAPAKQEPKGALADLVRARGELVFLPVPEPPKPWEDARVSPAQKAVLRTVIARVAPAVAGHADVVDALSEAYGFHVRELAQAAERLALAGDISPAAVRAQAGAGECSLARLEKAVMERDRAAAARLLGRLAAGGVLTDWRGEPVDPGGIGPVLTGALGRFLRNALAIRLHALRCGLADELDPAKCAARFWYGGRFKDNLYKTLAADATSTPDSPLAGMSPWPAHLAFRLAAAYSDHELIDALASLAALGVERAPASEAVPALTSLLLKLTAPRETKPAGAPPAKGGQRGSRSSRS